MSPQRRITVLTILIGTILPRECTEKLNSEIAETLNRPVRSLAFPSSSSMGIFFALAVPLDDLEHSISLSYFFEASYTLPENFSYYEGYRASRKRRGIDRRTIYEILENKFESAGFSGRECLLRSICETSEWPIRHNGILGDAMHVILTPSTSRSENLPQEFTEAEKVGRNGTCSKSYSLCPLGLFDIIGTFVGA